MPSLRTPVRYPGGVNTSQPGHPYANFGRPYQPRYHEFFNDFDDFQAAQWIVTVVGTGTAVVQFLDGGILKLTNTAADDDSVFLQWSGVDAATATRSWSFESGKQLWMSSRFVIDSVTQTDVIFGLQGTDTSPLAVTDGVFFRSPDGTNVMSLVSSLAGAEVSVACGTLVSGTYAEWAAYYDGRNTLFAYKDGVLQAQLDVTGALPLLTTYLTPSFGVQNGEAVAHFMQVDYINFAKERFLYAT